MGGERIAMSQRERDRLKVMAPGLAAFISLRLKRPLRGLPTTTFLAVVGMCTLILQGPPKPVHSCSERNVGRFM